MTYDSTFDTKQHIQAVADNLTAARMNLAKRALVHDASKLREPEKSLLDKLGTQTNLPPYGSPEELARREALTEMREHHYRHNTHHPEHYPNGVAGMSLLDLIEMLCDWQAAGARHVSGTLEHSLNLNRERFGLSDELYGILVNTARELGWLK